MSTLAEQYYVKALSNYPWNLTEVMESLDYALSADDQHVGSNLLLGRVYMERMNDFEKAETCFQDALSSDPTNYWVYERYAFLLLHKKDHERALKMIAFAEKMELARLPILMHIKGQIHEQTGELKVAVKCYKNAAANSIFTHWCKFFEREASRVNGKTKKKKKSKKGKKKSKKKK